MVSPCPPVAKEPVSLLGGRADVQPAGLPRRRARQCSDRLVPQLDLPGEVDLVVKRDAVVADPGDLGFLLAGLVDRAGPELGQPEAAALVEAERVDVVVGGGEPDPRQANRTPRCYKVGPVGSIEQRAAQIGSSAAARSGSGPGTGPSHSGVASVDQVVAAGDEGCGVGGQEDRQRGNLVRCAEPSEGVL